MNKFRAKLRFKEVQNVEYLVKEFFKDFSPESSITVKGRNVTMEIVFDKVPENIVYSMHNFDDIELQYGKHLAWDDSCEEASEQPEQVKEQEEASEEPEQVEEQEETHEESKQAEEEQEGAPVESEQAEEKQEETPGESEQAEEEQKATPEESEQAEEEQEEAHEQPEQAEEEQKEIPAESEQVEEEQEETHEESKQAEEEQEEAPEEPEQKQKIMQYTLLDKPTKPAKIPELEELAQRATSFEDFAESVGKWLKMEKWQRFFVRLINITSELTTINWSNIEREYKKRWGLWSLYEKMQCSKQFYRMMKERNVELFKFMDGIKKYKEYPFKTAEDNKDEESADEAPEEEMKQDAEKHTLTEEVDIPETETFKEEISQEEVAPKARVKMNCMPEIQDFEEMLASIDKTRPVEEKIYIVLALMGLESCPKRTQQQLVYVIAEAIKRNPIDIQDKTIFEQADIPLREMQTAIMELSSLINMFVRKNGSDKKVKNNEFLSDLKKIVMPADDMDTNVEDFLKES